MAYVLFLLAIVSLIAGVWLWVSAAPERKSWAEARGFSFAKTDASLVDDWQRGAAATGSPATNVATGNWNGRDTYVADLGATTVVAMRTGAVSDVVVDIRREGFAAASSEDLVEVARVGGFVVFGTEASVVERFVDKRVRDALAELPATVAAVWFEGQWALAEVGHDAPPEEWEAAFAPLALLADAARTLPPANPQPLVMPFQTRAIPDAPEPETPLVAAAEQPPKVPPVPKVPRPEEPFELPTRTTGAVRGSVQPRAVGADEVNAIASGPATAPHNPNDLTRASRPLSPPSIFDTSDTTKPTTPKEPTDE